MTNDLRRSRLIAESLLNWFKANKRDFPWRDSFANPDPFVILFTEIMLQRTKADQVVPVYVEFVKRYPSFEALRSASSDEVASLFSQLGLAWRAKNLVNLIRVLEERYRGEIPQTFSALRELPGIGDYVAKAVLCYAFGQSVVPIDTNVVRVVSRLFGIDI